ncbi:MAG: ParB N-terminal domain-containing protein [Candidatus Acidiferrales bacterium]
MAVLRESILREGCREPLTVWKTDDDQRIIVDGHNRYNICMELKLEPPFQKKKFSSRDEVKLWMLEHQLGRRNLTDDQRTMVWASIAAHRSVVAKARQLEAARAAKNTGSDNVSHPEPKVNTLKAVTQESGLSERALRAAMKLEKTNPDVAARVRKGDLKLREAKKVTAVKDNRTRYSEKDYFARIGRALATSLIDKRLTELANMKKKDFTPETKQGLQNLILNLKDVKTRAQEHIDALNKTLERCK